MAIEDKISNSGTTVNTAEDLKETSGKTHAVEAEILGNAEAKPSGAHTPIAIHPQVQEAGVTEVLEPHHEMVSGSEVHAGSVDGSGIALPPKEQAIVKELFDSRKNLGPADKSSTWNNLEGIRDNLLRIVRGEQKKAA